nr:tegument serine/threonine protein kinase [Macronycteris gammaherpesvirus 1]
MTQLQEEIMNAIVLQTPSWSGRQTCCPKFQMDAHNPKKDGVLEMLLTQREHMSITSVMSSKVLLKPAPDWTKCKHGNYKLSVLLGQGAYGKVEAVSKTECIKSFINPHSFYHELMVCDLIELARLRSHCPEKSQSLLSFTTACMPCKALFFPRYSCSLNTFSHWSEDNISKIVSGFEGLLDAVIFLNEECGLFHSDISLCNILVDGQYGDHIPGRLVLADFGLATLHTGNSKIHLGLTSTTGKPLYRMFVKRGPFMVCKDSYKPACVLLRCFKIASSHKWDELDTDKSPICPAMAKTIDISSLAYCLLNVIEKVLDVSNMEPTDSFYLNCSLPETNPQYYLKCLVHKVVLLEHLSKLWKTDINIGVNSKGDFCSLELPFKEKEEFQSWCRQLETKYISYLYPYNYLIADNINLRDCLINLLSLDFFSLYGRET